MTLTGANILSENNNNNIYALNSIQTGQYCVVVPKNTDGEISMLVDMNMKSDFDSLASNTITKEQLIEKINNEYSNVVNTYPSGVLVMPMTDIGLLTNAVNSNDKQKIFDETKKIGGITSELYKKLTESGIEKSRINQKIMIIEKTDIDTKFVEWLKQQMPNFVDGIKLETTTPKVESNTTEENSFANINPFTGENSEEQPTTTEQNITPPTEETSIKEVASETQTTTDEPAPVQEPTSVIPESNDIFGTPSQAVEATPVVSEPVIEPQPVQNTPLETPQPVVNNQEPTPSPVPEQAAQTAPANNIDKKSGGFANLLILLVVLVGVTVASIELGKLLYNTFGA